MADESSVVWLRKAIVKIEISLMPIGFSVSIAWTISLSISQSSTFS